MAKKKIDAENALSYDTMENALNILYPLYQKYGWAWLGQVPRRNDIRNSIVELAQDMIDRDSRSISSGRLHIYWSDEDSIGVALNVGEFYLNEYGQDEETVVEEKK